MRTGSDNIILSSASTAISGKATETPIIHAPRPPVQIGALDSSQPTDRVKSYTGARRAGPEVNEVILTESTEVHALNKLSKNQSSKV